MRAWCKTFSFTQCIKGIGHKYDDVRRELKPLLKDARVTDEGILRQVTKIMSDENDRQRRLGSATRPRPTNIHSVQVEANAVQHAGVQEGQGKSPSADVIQQLTDKVEKLTSLVEALQKSTQLKPPEQHNQSLKKKRESKREQRNVCVKGFDQNRSDCTHCFSCGGDGHRAIGCVQKPMRQGNGGRFLPGNRQ